MIQTILKSHKLDPEVQKDLVAAPLYMEKMENPSLEELINCRYQEDLLPNRVLQFLANGANYSKDLTIANCAVINGRLHYRDNLYVPDYHDLCLHLCCLHHDSPHTGYLRIGKTYEQLHRNYYWPNMQAFVKKYICHCNTCKHSKGSWFKKQGVFWLLSVPD